MKLSKIYYILGLFIVLVMMFFWRSLVKGEIPMPGDHIVGVYHPWLDYSWPGYPAGVPVKNPLMADVPSLFYPQKTLAIDQLKQGVFPLWNPLIFNGYPLLANFQSAILNPFNFYFLLFPFTLAWTLFIAAQPLLSLIFTYYFLRILKLNRLPAILGSIIYAFCGFNLLWLEYGIHGYVSAWIPLLFLLIIKKYYFLTATIFAVQLFSGYPQLSLYSIIFLGLWQMWCHHPNLKSVFPYLFSVILGLGISGILLIPGLELFSLSQRVGEPLSGSASGAYYQFKQLITLIAPDFFGNPATYNTWGQVDYTNNTGYASVIGIILAIIGLSYSKNRHRWYFFGLYLACLSISLPTPISFFIQKLPLFSASVVTRIMVFCGLAVSVLASMGMQHLITVRKFSLHLISPLLILISLLIGYAFWALRLSSMTGLRNLILPAILIGLSGLIILLAVKKSSKWLWFLIIFTAFELFRFGWKYNPFFPSNLIFPSTPEIQFLQTQKNYRIDGGDVLPLSIWMQYGLSSSTGYDAVYPDIWAKYLSAIDTGNIISSKGRIGDIQSYSSRLFDLTGTGYVLALKHNQEIIYPRFILPKFSPIFDTKSFVIYQNTQAVAKYSLRAAFETITNDQDIINRLQNPDFNYLSSLILSELPQKPNTELADNYTLTVKSDGFQHQEFETYSDQPIFLLNTTSYYPGWIAFIDGLPTKIYRANYAFQAVLVPAGRHLIEFTYHPRSLTIGICVSLISIITLYAISRGSAPKRTP